MSVMNDVVSKAVLDSSMKVTNSKRSNISGLNKAKLRCDKSVDSIASLPVCENPHTGTACEAALKAHVEQCTMRDSEVQQSVYMDLNFTQENNNELAEKIRNEMSTEIDNAMQEMSDSLGETTRAVVDNIMGGQDKQKMEIVNEIKTEAKTSIDVDFVNEMEDNVSAMNDFNATNYAVVGSKVGQTQSIEIISAMLSRNQKLVDAANKLETSVENDLEREEKGIFGLMGDVLTGWIGILMLVVVGFIVVAIAGLFLAPRILKMLSGEESNQGNK